MGANAVKNFLCRLLGLISVIGIASACTPRYTGPEYLTTPRQTPPQPVYNRVMMARPAEVLPSRKVTFQNAPKTSPILHLEVNNVSLEQATRELGSLARYRTYTAAAVADKNISLDGVGTIDELADTLGREAEVYVSVDHGNHEIRVLPPKKTSAKLYGK